MPTCETATGASLFTLSVLALELKFYPEKDPDAKALAAT